MSDGTVPTIEPQAAPAFKDRSGGLTLFGVLQIGLGCLAGLLAPLSLVQLTPAVRQQMERMGDQPPDGRAIAMVVTTYLAVAVFFIWTGIGAVVKRRWVRPVMICTSTLALLGGVVGTIVSVFVLPRMLAEATRETPGAPRALGLIVGTVVAMVLLMIYVVIPAALLLFYRSPHVQATLEARDPKPRWSDACPLPVLGLCLFLALGAAGMLLTAFYGVIPLFGAMLTGPSAVGACFSLAAVHLLVARSVYRLEPAGWWGSLIVFVVLAVSGLTFLATRDPSDYFTALRVPAKQLRILASSGLIDGPLMLGVGLIWLASVIGYLLWVRRYFFPDTAPATG